MNIRHLTVLFLIWASSCLHADIEAIARFEPSRITIGEIAKYVVEITDSETNALLSMERIDSLPVPSVDGISLRNGQTSVNHEARVVNGRAEYTAKLQIFINAIPTKPGSYTIPSFAFDYKDIRVQIPAATLTVAERSENAASTTNELIFLTLEAPEKLYVGQTELVALKLYVAGKVKLGDYMVEPDADGFIVDGGPPKEPIRSVENINGQSYRVYSWPLIITPVSPGKQDLNFQSTLIAQFPSQRNNRNNSFGSSIFDDLFGRAKRVNVYTKPTQVNILSLPTEGQPESFSGAIGQFNMGVSTDTKSTRVGEPIMLSLKLSGQGNFNRIQGPRLPDAKDWRSYPPESVFEADAANELKGTKRFDYVFIPEKAGTLELPEVSFSFFDPDVEKYIELSSPVIAVEVAPSNLSAAPPPPHLKPEPKGAASTVNNLTKSLTDEELLRTLDYQPEAGRKLPNGSIVTPHFYWINGGLLAIVSIAVILSYRHKYLRQSPHHTLIQNAREELKVALHKTRSDDMDTFFNSAQNAVCLAATLRTKSNLRTADFTRLETHLRELGLGETVIDQVRTLFQAAEVHRFSGHRQAIDLTEYRKQLNNVLKAL